MTAIIPPSVIVFDLGGVVAEISHTWEDAATCAGVTCSNLRSHSTKLSSLEAFEEFQSGKITLNEYLANLAEFAGCTPDNALRVHNGILVTEYPGVSELVGEIKSLGLATGCLSNTNEPHWEMLALSGQYPTIKSLDMKMASHLVGLSKPSPAIFELYCETFELDPETIAFFDDYAVNVEAAQSCGWNARQIDPSKDTPTQMRAYLKDLGVF